MIKKIKKYIAYTMLLSLFILVGCQQLSSPDDTNVAINDISYDTSIEGWSLIWSDEFDNNIFDTDIWDRQVMMSPYNNEFQKYTGAESTAYEEDGNMVLKADWDGIEHSKGHYTSARVISNPGGYRGDSGSTGKTMTFGKISTRIKLPSGKGIWPAFWMLGDNTSETGGDTPWPSCGEIDILETGFSGNTDGEYGHATLGGAIHYDSTINDNTGWDAWDYLTDHVTLSTGIYADDYHVYEIEWDANLIVWRIDDVEFYSEDISNSKFNEFRKEFYLLFNIAVGGNLTDVPDNENTVFPQYMYIDWVRHYTKD